MAPRHVWVQPYSLLDEGWVKGYMGTGVDRQTNHGVALLGQVPHGPGRILVPTSWDRVHTDLSPLTVPMWTLSLFLTRTVSALWSSQRTKGSVVLLGQGWTLVSPSSDLLSQSSPVQPNSCQISLNYYTSPIQSSSLHTSTAQLSPARFSLTSPAQLCSHQYSSA